MRAAAESPLGHLGDLSISEDETPSLGTPHLDSGQTPQPDDSSPADPSHFGPSEDEILVNMSFVLLLNSLTERDGTMRSRGCRWLPNRDVYTIFGSLESVEQARLLEARTDGCLKHTPSGLSAAILEVKPYIRRAHVLQVEWQESAQVAAYIYTLIHSNLPPGSSFGCLHCNSPGIQKSVILLWRATTGTVPNMFPPSLS